MGNNQELHYSVIIPAYNEEDYLSETLSVLSKVMGEIDWRGEVIVVDNNSTDKTAEISSAFGATMVFEPVNQISRARNAGAEKARSDSLIFLDADTMISAPLLGEALVNLHETKCCGGGTLLSFDQDQTYLKRTIANFLNRVVKKINLVPGCFMYCSREAFIGINGFSEKLYATEEVWFMHQLKKWGKKNKKQFKVITRFKVVTSSRKFERPLRFFLTTIFYILFPFSVYFRPLCGYWYKRLPKN